MKKNRHNSEHYIWGDNFSGWHLVKSQTLSVIEELMPPFTKEDRHYHENAQQFFKILDGTATFEIDDKIIEVNSDDGIHILPRKRHSIRNNQSENLVFLVISKPSTRGDRMNE